MSLFDTRGFRTALGKFATGVTVITARSPEGEDVGVTASSFNSVSLEPPLVLWSLDKSSHSLPIFQRTSHFIVNILAAEQVELSNRFAKAGDDKFSDLEIDRGLGNVAMLKDCSAWFQCTPEYFYEGGDHLILVGRVMVYDESHRHGLLFQQGRYAVGSDHPMVSYSRPHPSGRGFVKNFLPFLTGRANQVVLSRYQKAVESGELTDYQYRILFSLEDVGAGDLETLGALTLLTFDAIETNLCGLVQDGLVIRTNNEFAITSAGSNQVAKMEAMISQSEKKMLSVFTSEEITTLKEQLERLANWNSTH